MPNTAQLIIQAIIDKKPLDVQEYVTEMMTEAASGMIQEKTVVYQDPEEFDDEFEDTDDDISDEELAGFFEDFHDEYGHLPEDEQLALMADFEAQLQEDSLNESLRKIKSYKEGNKEAHVYRDSEWNEYRVKLHKDGKHLTKADYHTNDKDDAHSTANYFVKGDSK